MELTIEQKQKKYEREKEWRIANPEKVKEYAKRSYEKNREYYRNYYKNYRIEHKEHMAETQKKWREFNIKKDVVYFFIDADGKNIYIGSSSRFDERMSAHLTGNSNIKISAEDLVEKHNLSIILYKEFTEYNLNRQDLFFIESHFKQYGELIENKVSFKEEELSKTKEELIDLAENKVEYQEFNKLERYLK